MTSSEHVLRISRSDNDEKYIFLNVSQNGPELLDLRLQATEGEYPYAADITSSLISSLRERKSVQTDSHWENTLLTALLQRSVASETPDQHSQETIETVAFVSPSRLTLVFRKNISGIKQRLGEITLHQDDNLELDTLSWTSIAISRGDDLEAQVASLRDKHASALQTVSTLKQQLEELITAKEAHEDALIIKFQILLNAKKEKIRDQQRLLAGANVVRGRARRIHAARRGDKVTPSPASAAVAHKPGESRRGKRKADEAALGDHASAEGEDSAFEGSVSLTRVKDEDRDEEVDGMPQTPDVSDEDATEDEDEEERGGDGEDEGGKPGNDVSENQRMQVDRSPPSLSDLPPDRELPFDKAAVRRQPEKVQSQQREDMPEEDQETDDDDDEL